MKSTLNTLIIFCLLASLAAPVQADGKQARELAAKCKTELTTYCQDVTPGRGRILSCLHAYSDKLSDQCEEAFSEAREEVKLLMSAIQFVQGECEQDVDRLCKDVVPGEGRIIRCLEENQEQVSRECTSALKEVGLRD